MKKYTEKDMTPWFKWDVRPEYPGLYQRDYGWDGMGDAIPDYWDGKEWYTHPTNAGFTFRASPHPWRGLKAKPSSVKFSHPADPSRLPKEWE